MAAHDEQNPEDPLDTDAGAEPHDAPGRFDFMRRMAAAGLGAVFMSEEGIRKLAGQLKLPKEALTFLMQQAERTKDDIGRTVSDEVRKFLQSDRLRDEFLKMIAGMTVEIRAEVKLVPDRVKGESASLMPKIQVSELKTKFAGEKKKKRDEKGEPDQS